MRVEELVDSLQTYELLLPHPKKGKSIALKTVKEEAEDSDDEKSLNDEDLALLVKRFRKFLKPRKGNSRYKPSRFAKKSKGESFATTQGKKGKVKKDKNSQDIKCH